MTIQSSIRCCCYHCEVLTFFTQNSVHKNIPLEISLKRNDKSKQHIQNSSCYYHCEVLLSKYLNESTRCWKVLFNKIYLFKWRTKLNIDTWWIVKGIWISEMEIMGSWTKKHLHEFRDSGVRSWSSDVLENPCWSWWDVDIDEQKYKVSLHWITMTFLDCNVKHYCCCNVKHYCCCNVKHCVTYWITTNLILNICKDIPHPIHSVRQEMLWKWHVWSWLQDNVRHVDARVLCLHVLPCKLRIQQWRKALALT